MRLKLYWVETPDHHEDWFIVASNAAQAEHLHEDFEGYEHDYATAVEVADIPEALNAEVGWPAEELLLALGASYSEHGAARVVKIDGVTYCEGLLEETLRSLDDDQFEARGLGRINETEKTPKTPH